MASGALAFQVVQDTAGSTTGVHPQVTDSVAAHPTFADPVIAVVQFIFQQSPWVMWGGVVVGVLVAAAVLTVVWKRRVALRTWLTTRSGAVKLAMLGGVAILAVGVAGLGYRANTFVEKDNRFCNGCHIFVATGQARIESDTGHYTLVNRLEGKHDTLSCHSCHELKPLKEAVKMVWWMSGVRDDRIPPHAKVPRRVCEGCHVQGDAKEMWQKIATTAGHRTHLESDSTALDSIQCITCHAQEVHRFVPVNTTCTQKGCHENTRIVLGQMSQTSVALEAHCTACHQFTAEVPQLATRDSAAGTLVPGDKQCRACHQMEARLPQFDPAKDPHKGTCGMCHDPHAQKEVQEAKLSCTNSSCHATWRDNPFHTGANHRRVAQQCTTCHLPHQARVDASDCTGCHQQVRARSHQKLQPPLPFDTTATKQRAAVEPPAREPRGKGDAPALLDSGGAVSVSIPAPTADSFPHTRHRQLPCLTCHTTREGQGGGLTFVAPRGCQICHHQAANRNQCVTCHQPDELAAVPYSATVSVTVGNHAARERTVPFRHEVHRNEKCVDCHTQAVTLAPDTVVRTCVSCHAQHHAPDRQCATCHRTEQIVTAHRRPVEAHKDCDLCHTPARVAELVPTRTLCLTCHADKDHYPPKQCTVCHFQSSPELYRAHLTRTGGDS
ncbi:MAG: hypothetical protein ABI679_08505 [Gemmatimonadota bacterium]